MPGATVEFFERLGENTDAPFEALPPRIRGTIRLDVQHEEGTDHWFITLDKGKVHVSRRDQEANVVVRGPMSLFDRLVRGEERVFASLLRNEMNVEGDTRLMPLLDRLLPAPPDAHDPRLWHDTRPGGPQPPDGGPQRPTTE